MDNAPGGPMGLGDILDETIRLYRQQALVYIGLMALAFVPITILATLAGAGFGLSAFLDPRLLGSYDFWAGAAGTLVLFSLLFFVAFLLSQGAATEVAAGGFLAHPLQLRPAFASALRHFLGLLGITMLMGGLLLGAAVADLAATGLLFALNPLLGLAVLVLRVPVALLALLLYLASRALRRPPVRLLAILAMPLGAALYLGVRWSLFVQTLVLEGLGPRAALGRSWRLVDGYWWRTLGFLVLLAILVVVLQYAPGLLLGLVVFPAEALTQPGVFDNGLPLTYLATNLASALGWVIFGAVQWLAMTVYYYDLRIRKEAFDLELRVRRLRET
ncbi:MAG: glycerophosphoryl diester phosphodiesterase membrane domain-containing protein [Chloroflexi bacterium]|nr:glycerophosphoryl diester phosphodiesterase membrane domain-containing protein [Chloroflexota bacterium]